MISVDAEITTDKNPASLNGKNTQKTGNKKKKNIPQSGKTSTENP